MYSADVVPLSLRNSCKNFNDKMTDWYSDGRRMASTSLDIDIFGRRRSWKWVFDFGINWTKKKKSRKGLKSHIFSTWPEIYFLFHQKNRFCGHRLIVERGGGGWLEEAEPHHAKPGTVAHYLKSEKSTSAGLLLAPSLARLSAALFCWIPLCPGTHIMVTRFTSDRTVTLSIGT